MRERNFEVDIVKFSANFIDGEFFEGVHHLPHSPGGPVVADCPDHPFNSFLKCLLNGYR